jgi:Ca2+:H+ antiporter
MSAWIRNSPSWILPIGAVGLAMAARLGFVPDSGSTAPLNVLLPLFVICVLLATVLIVLRHADAVADRLGEPFGTLLVTFSVTAIEVSIIVSMMLHGENNPTLARESVFSSVMIVCAGVIGACLTLGALRHRQQDLKRQGTSATLAVLIALTVLTLILPNFILTTEPGAFSPMQLAFVSVLSILLYLAFLFTQTVRHRDDFIEPGASKAGRLKLSSEDTKRPVMSFLLLPIGLIGIVLLAKQVAAGVEDGLDALHVANADAIVGALIAGLVLLPEALSAIRAALNNELQHSLNIALGSALATIGLTIPAVAVASLITGRGLTLGLMPGDMVLLVLVLSISVVSFETGRTTVLTGLVHLVIFLAYLLLIAVN